MGEITKIAWTMHTMNPWIGCTKVSEGCDHCYAETLNHRWGNDNWGKGKPRRVTSDANWKQPLRWDKQATAAGEKHMVFCASLADVMDDEAPIGARERLWELISNTPNLIWQLLTKRPQRYARYLPSVFRHNNVWLGTTAENQHYYDIRFPYLREAASARGLITFVSYEPALGPLTLKSNVIDGHFPVPDQLICGGESGHERRPMEVSWAENIKKECEIYGVKFFMKQLSARTPEQGAALIPASLLIRQFPEVN